jgi:hypothetical protein
MNRGKQRLSNHLSLGIMKLEKVLIYVFILFSFSTTFAQKIEEPEECLLRVIQSASKDQSGVIRHACTRKFLKASESRASLVPLNLISNASAYWQPRVTTVGYPNYIESQMRIDVKNNSFQRLIAIVFHLTNNETKAIDTYRIYADSPIEPFSAGFFYGAVKVDERIIYPAEFLEKYTWSIQSISGISNK